MAYDAELHWELQNAERAYVEKKAEITLKMQEREQELSKLKWRLTKDEFYWALSDYAIEWSKLKDELALATAEIHRIYENIEAGDIEERNRKARAVREPG